MDAQPEFGLQDLLTHFISDMAQAVAGRDGGSPTQRTARAQAAAATILAFQPGDVVEAMLAGHCVMFHELIVDTVHTTLRGEPDASRAGIVAMDKAFGDNLRRLERYRTRDAVRSADTSGETAIADRVRRHRACVSPVAAQAAPAGPRTASNLPNDLAESTTGDPREPTDPIQHPQPAGGPVLGEADPVAARMAGLNRQARRQMRRQANKGARAR